MTGIFISYRREDTGAFAEQLYQILRERYDVKVFLDKHEMVPGKNWRGQLTEELRNTDIVLALIGPKWVELLHERNQVSEEDWVQFEIAKGLKCTHIIPILCDGAVLPTELELKRNKELIDLRHYHTLEVTDTTDIRDDEREKLFRGIDDATQLHRLNRCVEPVSVPPEEDTPADDDDQEPVEPPDPPAPQQPETRSFTPRSYKAQLLEIIATAGASLHTMLVENKQGGQASPPDPLQVRKHTLRLQECARLLALADIRTAEYEREGTRDTERDSAGEENDPLHYGYRQLIRQASNNAEKSKAYAARRALAFYEEYNKPPRTTRKDARVAGFRKPGKEKDAIDYNWLTVWAVRRQQLQDTWQEFVSQEFIGGAMFAVVLALAFAFHTVLTQNFMMLNPDLHPDGCWYIGGPDELGACWQGISFSIVAWLVTVAVCWWIAWLYNRAAYGRRVGVFEVFIPTMGFLLGMVGLVWALENNPSAVQAGAPPGLDFLFGFIASGALALPGAILMLAAIGWSSVMAGQRRTRAIPRVHWLATVPATSFGLTLSVLLLAAAAEKSRPHAGESLVLIMLWGLVLGIVIWSLRQGEFFYQDEADRAAQPLLRRLAASIPVRLLMVCLVSIVFVVGMTQLGRIVFQDLPFLQWPANNLYLHVPALVSDPNDDPVVQAFREADGPAIALSQLVLFGLWIGTAIFFSVEVMNSKMMNPEPAVDSVNNPHEHRDALNAIPREPDGNTTADAKKTGYKT